VRNAALDVLRGLNVIVATEAVRGADLNPGDLQRALEEIAAAGGTLR
jgi:hypothetical protein